VTPASPPAAAASRRLRKSISFVHHSRSQPANQRKKCCILCLLALLYPHTLSSSFDHQSIVKSNGFYDSLHQSYSSEVSVGCSRCAAVVYSQFWVSSSSSLCTTSRSKWQGTISLCYPDTL
jgi:hypothetical protein